MFCCTFDACVTRPVDLSPTLSSGATEQEVIRGRAAARAAIVPPGWRSRPGMPIARSFSRPHLLASMLVSELGIHASPPRPLGSRRPGPSIADRLVTRSKGRAATTSPTVPPEHPHEPLALRSVRKCSTLETGRDHACGVAADRVECSSSDLDDCFGPDYRFRVWHDR